jgi:ABC-2 type transport system permease protein
MNKIILILSREYFIRVKKKSFLITTLLVPLIIIGFYAAIVFISLDSNSTEQKVALIDEANLFEGKIFNNPKHITFTFIKNETEASYLKKYSDAGYDALLIIPSLIPNDSISKKRNKYILHSEAAFNLSSIEDIENLINNTIVNKQLIASGIDPKIFKAMGESASIENTIETEDGAKKSFAGVAYGVSFACGMLIYIMMLTYGTQVMRAVTEEKTNRIAEVIISSVKPFQLMLGKILGIGAVGLTQFAIWIILMVVAQMAIPIIFPDLMNQVNNAALENQDKMSVVADTLQGLSALPVVKIVSYFLFYFLGGYLTYASLFAAIGSVVSEDQQEAQQLVMPVLMPIILGFVIMNKAVNDPNSTIAVVGSIFPLTSPIVMMGRITYDVPVWQMALSMFLLVCCFLFFTWITGKVYRTGILMYGKKIKWKEIIKWAFVK